MSSQRELANGVTITYFDQSKKIAGDRYLVKVRCLASIPLQGWMVDALAASDPQTEFCRERLAGNLTHEIVMERNFIDETEREKLLSGMISSLEEAVLGYLSKESFVRQLFARKVSELVEQYGEAERVKFLEDEEEPPGVADFSACFR